MFYTGENNSSSASNTGSQPASQARSGAPVTGGTTATMTVTSPAWSGTSWTGGMAYGCTAALKTTGTGGKKFSEVISCHELSMPSLF